MHGASSGFGEDSATRGAKVPRMTPSGTTPPGPTTFVGADAPVLPPVDPRRRTVLRGAAGGAAATVAAPFFGASRAGAQVDPGLAPFPHGVASGDPLQDRVIIWTRFDPEGLPGMFPVSWLVFTDLTDPEGTVVRAGSTTAKPESDWTIKVDVTGLDPYTTYYYEFMAPDGRCSLIGRTRTAPGSGPTDPLPDRLKFGVCGCANYPAGWFNAYGAMALRNDLDAILHTGDYQYEGSSSNTDRPVGAFETITLDQYRERTKAYRLDSDLRRLHQLFPMICTWDDHESTNNSYYAGAGNHTEGAEGNWFDRKNASAQAYDEFLPFRKPDQTDGPFGGPRTYEDGMRIYRTVEYGPLARIIVLDTRIEGRDEEAATPAVQADAEDPNRTILGATQRQWLFDQLTQADADGVQWKVVLQQVMFQQWNVGGIPDLGLGDELPGSFITFGDGGSINGDAWDGYVADRDRVLDHIETGGASGDAIDDVVILTGDIHMAFGADIARDPFNPAAAFGGYDPLTGDGSLAVEFVNQSVTSSGLGEIASPEIADGLALASRVGNPHQKYTDFKGHGYFVLTLDTEAAQADWYNVDTIDDRDLTHAHVAAWATETRTNHLVASTEAPTGTESDAPPLEPRDHEPTAAVPEFSPGVAGVAALGAAGLVAFRNRRRDANAPE